MLNLTIIAGGRFGSFDFANGRLECRAKPNVPNVDWQEF